MSALGTAGQGFAWIGESDAAVEGEWRWVTGPEAGTQFWQGDTGSGVTPPFNFARWGSTEPNDSADEDSGVFALDAAFLPIGEWADANAGGVGVTIGYWVEFPAVPEPSVVSATRPRLARSCVPARHRNALTPALSRVPAIREVRHTEAMRRAYDGVVRVINS